MIETIQQIHNTAMELSDLARIKKIKEGEVVYRKYLKAAYELEVYAASKLQAQPNLNDQLWRATLLRSASWLAYKCGYYKQAKNLVEMGLDIPADGYALAKLQELKAAAIHQLQQVNNLATSYPTTSLIRYGNTPN